MITSMRKQLWIVLLATGLAAPAFAQENRVGCGDLANAYGPYDYTDPVHQRDNLPIVEHFHFTRDVQNLRQGRSDTIAGDLDYTLRAFPNHHLALDSVARYQLANPRPDSRYYSADCYFDRAMRWRPEDARVRMIYAIFLNKKGDKVAAAEQYESAISLDPQDAEINYNAGLFYLGTKEYDKARAHAETAYAGGFPLEGLRNKLIALKVWDGVVTTPPPVAATP
jgi:predicted Zn-dependent protease